MGGYGSSGIFGAFANTFGGGLTDAYSGGGFGGLGAADGIDKWLIGGVGSASGHSGEGYKEKSIDCNSALGLIGLLGLIELLRDVIGNVIKVDENDKDETRRKRDIGEDISGLPLVSFLAGGGAGRLLHTLPAVVLPMLHSAVDVNDGFETQECLQLSVCEANRVLLKESYTNGGGALGGAVGGLVSSLLSQVVAKSFTSDQETYLKALKAAEAGRKGENCRKAFYGCQDLKSQHTPLEGVNVTMLVQQHLLHAT
ncbi:uncharacterized protein LOC121864047 [Homarus americanus]|uniref:uncharacterized protein LOC121864047 n=1 Tax=Homarus americanus TaxID=6706 RepID=UPI001C45431F|nr:uncharacterized protein LOC121864047 [Homarus americanus]